MISMYGLCLIAALAVGGAVFFVRARRAKLPAHTTPLLAVLAVVLGALCGRAYLHLTKYAVGGMGLWGYTLLSSRPYEYAVCGVVLGVLLAAALTAKWTKQSACAVLDALAPAGLFALAVARFGEYFSDFGWGQVLEGEAWRFFPVSVQDLYGQWHLAVFMLEGVMALAVGAYALRFGDERPGARFFNALLWWAATQIFCESLRAETIRWGFVRVQQLQCAVFMLGVLAVYARRAGGAKRAAPALAVFVLGIGVLVFVEYALDKIDAIPTLACYALMAAALAAMAGTIFAQRSAMKTE